MKEDIIWFEKMNNVPAIANDSTLGGDGRLEDVVRLPGTLHLVIFMNNYSLRYYIIELIFFIYTLTLNLVKMH